MNSFTKKMPLVISIISAVSFGGVAIHQSGIIKNLRIDLKKTINKLTQTQELLDAEMALTASLQNEKAVLEDSIDVLHVEIATLHEKIAEQKATIRQLNQKVEKLQDNVNGYSKQIAELRQKADTDQALLRKVEAERDKALAEMEIIDRQRAKIMEEAAAAERAQAAEKRRLEEMRRHQATVESRLQEQLEAPQPKLERPATAPSEAPAPAAAAQAATTAPPAAINDQVQERIRKVVTATAVDYSSVQLKMQENGAPLNRLKRNQWRHLSITLNLTNPDAMAIADEEFIIQVFDLDNKQVVPVNESNPRYPESNQGAIGYRFKYGGQPLTIQYFNSQEKTGSNYELRIFYAKNNVLLPLKNGTLRIVEDGKVMR